MVDMGEPLDLRGSQRRLGGEEPQVHRVVGQRRVEGQQAIAVVGADRPHMDGATVGQNHVALPVRRRGARTRGHRFVNHVSTLSFRCEDVRKMDRAVGVRVLGAVEKDQRRCRKLNDTEHDEDRGPDRDRVRRDEQRRSKPGSERDPAETSGTVRPDQVRDLRNVGRASQAGTDEAGELGGSQHERLSLSGWRCARSPSSSIGSSLLAGWRRGGRSSCPPTAPVGRTARRRPRRRPSRTAGRGSCRTPGRVVRRPGRGTGSWRARLRRRRARGS